MKRRILIIRSYLGLLFWDIMLSPWKDWKEMRSQSKEILDHVKETTKEKRWTPYKGKLGIVFLLLLSSAAFGQQNRKTYSFTVNSSYQVGYNIEGRVLIKRTAQNNGLTEHYIVLVRHNTTMLVKIEQKACFDLIKEKDYIVLPNCKLINHGN